LYQKALEDEFQKENLNFESQKHLAVYYEKKKIGDYVPDFLIDNRVIIEIKSSGFLTKHDEEQTFYYLRGSGYKLALLINFGAPRLQIKRLVWFPMDEYQRKSAVDNQRQSIKVELIAPWTINRLKDDPFEFYKVKRIFKIKKLPALDLLFLGFFTRFFFLLRSFCFSFCALLYFFFLKLLGRLKNTIFFSHDHIPLYFISFLNLPFVLDIHDFPLNNFLYRRVLKKALGFAVQTKWKIKELEKRFGIPPAKIVYWPNGTEVEDFDIDISVAEARDQLGLRDPRGRVKIALYTGHFFAWKGVYTLALASAFLDDDVFVYFVGGSPEDAEKFETFVLENKLDKVRLIGFRPHQEIPIWLKAADVLVLPNTGKEDISLYYTSPMKLFEYMAAKKPIVASNIPSILEILNQENSVLADPDNPEALAKGIKKVLSDKELAEKISNQAHQDVQKYAWEERARRIGEFLISNFY
jgi:GxxExxY protein